MSTDQGEKTEKATPHKRREARKKGQVLKSAEVNTAVLTMTMFAALYLFGGDMVKSLGELLVRSIVNLEATTPLTENSIHLMFVSTLLEILQISLPLLLTAVVVGMVVNLAQVGFLFSSEPLRPKFSKLNPIQGFKRIFSLRSLIELLKAVLKVTVVGVVVYQEYMKHFAAFPGLMTVGISNAGQTIVSAAFSMAFKAVMALFALGMADYLYQWWEYERNLKMTKQEVKMEYKMQEGDPQIKAKRRQKQREISMMRMMQSMPKADVVITNPTHYAIALRYKEEEAPAPIVIAKGKDQVAQRIKEKAKELGVEIVENKPVAQALFVACEVGDSIPEDLFAAVAEILARVYKAKNH